MLYRSLVPLLVAPLLLAICGAASGQAVLPPTTPLYASPVLFTAATGGAVVVPVTLGGAASADFLFDTGTNISCISQAMVARLRLTTHPLGGIDYQVGAATLVSTGGTTLPSPLSLLVDWTDGKYPSGFGGVGLGLDVLSRYRVLFDFAAKKMYLAPLAPVLPPAAKP